MRAARSRCRKHVSSLLAAAILSSIGASANAQGRGGAAERRPTGTPVTLQGTIEVVIADGLDHQSETLYRLRDDRTGRSYSLRFTRPARSVRTGTRVTVSGLLSRGAIYLASDGMSVTPSAETTTAASVPVSGDQRTLVVVANFRDSCVTCTLGAIEAMVFGGATAPSVDALFRETSRGQVTFSGTVVGPFTLSASSSDPCDYGAWGDEAAGLAQSAGVDVAAYARTVFVMPGNTCPGMGFGQLGGSRTSAWVFDCQTAGLYAHELGHNLGMQHASTLVSEYGDTSDAMGMSDSWLTPMNAPHRHQLGWLGPSSVASVTSSGTYTLSPLAADPLSAGSPQVLVIPKPDTGESYYVSYRHALGYDNYVDGSYRERVSVHRYAGDGSATHTYLLGALLDAERFDDAVNGVTVTLLAHDAQQASVRIDLATPAITCGVKPAVSATPPSQSALAGSTLTYGVALTSDDVPGCPSRAFTMTPAAPAGWTATVSPSTLSLAPGTSASATLTVRSPDAVLAGTYAVTVGAVNETDGTPAASGSVAYEVSAPCLRRVTTLAAAPIDQAGLAGTSASYAITATNQDTGPCAAAVLTLRTTVPSGWGVSASTTGTTLVPGQSATFTVTVAAPAASLPGTYPIGIDVTDSVEPLHAATIAPTFTVVKPPDTIAPTPPSKVTAVYSQKSKQVLVSWEGSSDNVGVSGYAVYRNGVVVATPASTAYADSSVAAGATYTYTVTARDAAGNWSAAAAAPSVTVPGTKKR